MSFPRADRSNSDPSRSECCSMKGSGMGVGSSRLHPENQGAGVTARQSGSWPFGWATKRFVFENGGQLQPAILLAPGGS